MHNKDGKPDPSVLAVFHDYIKLMPLVAEANQMSEELMKVKQPQDTVQTYIILLV